jgi:hypothetical protein
MLRRDAILRCRHAMMLLSIISALMPLLLMPPLFR